MRKGVAGCVLAVVLLGLGGVWSRPDEPEGTRVVLFDTGIPRGQGGRVIDVASLRLDTYRLNPIVLVGHEMSVPQVVGRLEDIVLVGGQWTGTLVWFEKPPSWEGNWYPDQIKYLMEQGVLGVSVHVRDATLVPPTDEQAAAGISLIMTNAELIEVSVVVVGAYPRAVPVERF